MAIFSGRPDPYRVVDTNYPKDTQVQQLLGQAKKTRTAYNPDFMPARLGYKEYVIREGAMKQSESIMGHETAPATAKAVTGNHPERKDERDFSDRISKEITPNSFRIPDEKKTYLQCGFLPRTMKQWNSLPATLATAPSLNVFKSGVCELKH